MQMKEGKATATTATKKPTDDGKVEAAKITAAADTNTAKVALSPDEVDAEVEKQLREEMEKGSGAPLPMGADDKDGSAVGVGAVAEI